jgi:hypothetical protein
MVYKAGIEIVLDRKQEFYISWLLINIPSKEREL